MEAVARAFDLGAVLDHVPVPGGASHLVWRLRTTRGTWAVKRLNRSHEQWWVDAYLVSASIQLDAWSRGLPMPRPVRPPVESAPLLADVDGRSWLAHEWHDPVPPSPVPAWAGTTLAALHALPAGGTPNRRPHPVDEWLTWLDEAPGPLTDAVRAHLPDIAEAVALVEACDTTALTPVRTHGDVKPDNVLHTASGPLLVDWDGAAEDHAEWEVTRSALAFADLTDRAAFTTVVEAYESAGGRRPPADASSFAGLLLVCLGGAAWMLWRALGHRPVTPAERAAAGPHSLRLLADLRTALASLPEWTTWLR
ncbi:aminoglycoside phosphotransferase family protein [Saccharothrix longispora]|uniref:Ser/Thr protein kinase RdoA (MazF antagonist) n=1 Tax=Saccharothrix longispora TaxID=33920 RepID=A0ABU1Q505_9PSEU|nr:aminoglycoside phosphotransferase family protein [Saccharothrix longispora]MDR6597239.1 Ser/Thr protein kinase RdoA (MazF antagonist) [Saccharothrix longispora]